MGLAERMRAEGLTDKVLIPADGETLELPAISGEVLVAPGKRAPARPGLQKWVTARFAGT